MMNKRTELQAVIDIHQPDVIGVTEVKPKNWRYEIADCEIVIEGYELFHNLMKPGRGVVLYVRKELKPSLCEELNKHEFSESVFVECYLQDNEKVLLGIIYRSPNSAPENNTMLNTLLSKINDRNPSHLMIMGDFNYPQVDWSGNRCDAGSDHPASQFLKATNDAFLIQHQTNPTRYREGEKANIVDLIFTNRDDIVKDITTIAGIGKSDHFTILINLNCAYEKSPRLSRLNFSKTDFSKLRKKLSEADWDMELSGKTVNEAWLHFKDRLHEAVTKSTPMSRSSGRRGKSWMDRETLNSVRKKHQLFRIWQQTRNEEDYTRYIKTRNKARKMCRLAQKRQEKEVATDAKQNPKTFWKFIKSKTTIRSGVADLKKKDGNKTHTDKEKAETLNEFFQSVFTRENPGPLPDPPTYHYANTLEDINITDTKVQKVLANLNTGKSTGPDGINPLVLVKTADILAHPVGMIFRQTLKIGDIPDDWRQAIVTPIFKKGSRSDASNYRPVSLTCILCKCMEKIVRESIMDHLMQNNLITKEQHGFVSGRSCSTQLLEVLEDWTTILDEGGSVDAVYMDFQKAFDTVPHRRLLLKISAHGITGRLLGWTEAFLRGRRQRVSINVSMSQERNVTSGIPQGSVLGPLLFVIFINDLPAGLNSSVKMFADDTKVYTRSDQDKATDRLQEDLNKLESWSSKWLLKFHPQKCSVIKLGYKKSEAEYHMTGKNSDGSNYILTLAESEVEKDLGVIVDSRLSFKQHVAQCTTKANRIVGIIRRTFSHLTNEMFIHLFKAMVRPILEYGQAVWQPHQKNLCSDLEDVQRRATKLLDHLKDKPYPERLRALRLPSLEHRRHRGDMIEVYKYINGFYKVDSPKLLFADAETRDLRGNTKKLLKVRSRLNVRSSYFSNRIVNSWNSLPDNVVNAPTLNSFKSRLDIFWENLPEIYSPTCQNL